MPNEIPAAAVDVELRVSNSRFITHLAPVADVAGRISVSLTLLLFTTRYAGDTEARSWRAGPCPLPEDCCADLPRCAAMNDGFIPACLAAQRGKSAQHSKSSDGGE
jgi:hypothetical protein